VAIDLGIDTTTPTGELVANIMAAVSRWERQMIGVRTREGLAEARKRGVRLGGPVLVPAEVAQRIVRDRRAGSTYSAIAEALNDDHVPTTRGERWHASTVRAVARRAA
jgi:DNA invertase Pin-like site-specific DNA recombinase